MKHCNTCKTDKEESEFHKRTASRDGLAAICKTCQRVYDKARANHAHRVEARAVYAQTEEGRLASNKAKAEYRKRNPEKTRAHNILARTIRAGHMTRPQACTKCGKKGKVDAHHDDYSKALDVRWLCSACHSQHHSRS